MTNMDITFNTIVINSFPQEMQSFHCFSIKLSCFFFSTPSFDEGLCLLRRVEERKEREKEKEKKEERRKKRRKKKEERRKKKEERRKKKEERRKKKEERRKKKEEKKKKEKKKKEKRKKKKEKTFPSLHSYRFDTLEEQTHHFSLKLPNQPNFFPPKRPFCLSLPNRGLQ